MLWIGLLLLIAFLFYSVREPFEGSPSDFVQEQAGEIDAIYNKLQTVTLTSALVESLQSDNDQTTDQINQLKENLPS